MVYNKKNYLNHLIIIFRPNGRSGVIYTLNNTKERIEYLKLLDDRAKCLFHELYSVCGIYAIINKLNGKVYIGKTTNNIYRYIRTQRLYQLRNGQMHNQQLQFDFNKYGETNFEIFILEKFLIINEESREKENLETTLNYLEVYYINTLQANKIDNGYNILIGGENDKNIDEIKKLISNEKIKRDEWAYGNHVNLQSFPFGIPENYITKNRIKFPAKGLGSIIDIYIKDSLQVTNFEEYINRFINRYSTKDYVMEHIDLIPLLLAQQLIQKFSSIPIIKLKHPQKCFICNKEVSERAVTYCVKNNYTFRGNIYCYEHQR